MLRWFLALGASAFTSTQMTEVESALTSSANTVLDTFIGLLPIIALIVGVIFGINFVSRKFKNLQNKKA